MRQCPRCGRKCYGKPWLHTCRDGRVHKIGFYLGNFIHDCLAAIGITPERWLAASNVARRAAGLKPAARCGCHDRQRRLNGGV